MPNLFNRDPTRTLTLRAFAVSELNRRFNEIKRVVRLTVSETNLLTVNAEPAGASRFAFLRDAEKVGEFESWLDEQVQEEILGGGTPGENWLNGYVGTSYGRGAQKTRSVIARKYANAGLLPTSSIFTNPAHIERAELIYTRTFSSLKGVTDVMGQQMSRVLSDGILRGQGIKEISDGLTNRIDKIGKTRATLIARTEIVNAHNTASITEAETLEGSIGEEVKMRWQTALDGREREEHHNRHNKIYTKKVAATLIGEPNCRCAISPVVGEEEEAQESLFSEEEKDRLADDYLKNREGRYASQRYRGRRHTKDEIKAALSKVGDDIKNLTKVDLEIFQNWTSGSDFLRSQFVDDVARDARFSDHILLKSMPQRYKHNYSGRAYRGIAFDNGLEADDFIKDLRARGSFSDPRPSSWTKNRNTGLDFANGVNIDRPAERGIFFKVDEVSGFDINAIPNATIEVQDNEVLVDALTEFDVSNIERQGKNYIVNLVKR